MRIETPPSAMPAPDTLTEINYPRKELVHGLIETRRVYVLSAQIGFGKSNIARHMAYSVASGQPFFGVRTPTSRVAFVNGEIESDSLQELDHRVPEGTELVVFDFPSTVINHGSGGSLSELAERRKLAIFATSRRPGPALLDDPNIEHWRADYIDAAGAPTVIGRLSVPGNESIRQPRFPPLPAIPTYRPGTAARLPPRERPGERTRTLPQNVVAWPTRTRPDFRT